MIGPPEVAAFVLDRLGRAALEQAGRRWSGPQLLADVEARSVVLRDLGVRAGMRVALRVPLGHDYVVGLLASLCCGASVIPVDPADEWAWATALRLCGPHVAISRYGCSPVDAQPVATIAGEAWLMPTSGSSGTPRIVVGSARGLLERLSWGTEWFAAPAADRCGVLSPGTFIDALTHTLQTLAAGRVLVLPPLSRDTRGAWLRPFLATSALNQLVSVPSVLPALAADPGFRLPELTRWVLSGELLRARHVELARQIAPSAEVLNVYGSTETTGDIAVSSWPPGSEVPDPVPVGHVQATIPWRLVPGGQGTRELQCGGEQVALALLGAKDPVETQDGVRWYDTGDSAVTSEFGLTVTGRVGGTGGFAKVRGRRVDLALVEGGLESLPGIREATVLVQTGPMGTSQLVGVVATDAPLPDWRAAMRSRVPASHVPDRVVALPGIPRTSSGKVDHAAALRLSQNAPSNGTSFADAVASVAAEVLGDDVPSDETLADAGLDSLSAVALAAMLEEAFAVPCTPEDLFREGSLANVASFLLAQPIGNDQSVRCLRAARRPMGSAKPTPKGARSAASTVLILFPPAVGTSLGYVRLVSRLHFAGQVDAIELGGPEQEALEEGGQDALARLCANHIEARHHSAPIICLGWSFGAAVAVRCQIELARRGHDTPHIILLDPAMLVAEPGEDVQAWARQRLWEDSGYPGPAPMTTDAFIRTATSSGRLTQVHSERVKQWLWTLSATRRAAAEGFPPPPTATATVLRARIEDGFIYPSWLSDPGPLMTVIDIHSTHFGLLGGDALLTVGSVIDAALERANQEVVQ